MTDATCEILDLRLADDPRDVIHRAVERLAAGGLVGLPTESSYTLAALATRPEAVAALQRLGETEFTLSVRSADEALDYAAHVGAIGERLFRRLWPGPTLIETSLDGKAVGLSTALPEAVYAALVFDGRLRFNVSGYDVVSAVMRLLPAPLVMPFQSAREPLLSAADLHRRFGDAAELLIEDGPPPLDTAPSVVRLSDDGWELVFAGHLDAAAVRERTGLGVVFVCTGNTCRSPLAEAIFRKLLAERLCCAEDELPNRGFFVGSAGLAASPGHPAASESLALAQEHGLNLGRHRSRPLTDDLLDRADHVFTMTAGHRALILAARPDLTGQIHLLSREGLDIADPIGGGPAEYEQCRAEIERELLAIMETLPLSFPNDRDG